MGKAILVSVSILLIASIIGLVLLGLKRKTLKEELDSCKSNLDKIAMVTAISSSSLDAAKQVTDECRSEYNQLQAKYKQLESNLSSLSSLKNEVAQLNSQIDELKTSKGELQTAYSTALSSSKDAERAHLFKIANLEADLKKKEEDVAKANEKVSNLESRLVATQGEMDLVKAGMESSEKLLARINYLEQEVSSTKQERDLLLTERATLDRQLTQANSSLDEELKKNKSLAIDLANLNQKLISTTSELEVVKSQLTSAESNFRTSQANLDGKTAEVKILKEQIANLETKLSTMQTNYDSLKAHLDAQAQLGAQLPQLERQVANLSSALESKEADLKALQMELDKTVQERGILLVTANDLKKEKALLIDKVTSLESAVSSGISERDQLKSQLDGSNIKISELTLQLDQTRASLKTAQDELTSLRATLASTQGERDELLLIKAQFEKLSGSILPGLQSRVEELLGLLSEATKKSDVLEVQLNEANSKLQAVILQSEQEKTALRARATELETMLLDRERQITQLRLDMSSAQNHANRLQDERDLLLREAQRLQQEAHDLNQRLMGVLSEVEAVKAERDSCRVDKQRVEDELASCRNAAQPAFTEDEKMVAKNMASAYTRGEIKIMSGGWNACQYASCGTDFTIKAQVTSDLTKSITTNLNRGLHIVVMMQNGELSAFHGDLHGDDDAVNRLFQFMSAVHNNAVMYFLSAQDEATSAFTPEKRRLLSDSYFQGKLTYLVGLGFRDSYIGVYSKNGFIYENKSQNRLTLTAVLAPKRSKEHFLYDVRGLLGSNLSGESEIQGWLYQRLPDVMVSEGI